MPTYRQDVTLTPEQQSALTQQNQLTNSLYGLANQQEGRISSAISQPFDTSKLPTLPTDINAYDKAAGDSIYNQATSRLDPQWAQSEATLRQQLADQGIAQNSDPNSAYGKAIDAFNRQKTDAYTSARNAATTAAGDRAAQTYGLAQAGRSQGIQEQSFLREQPLNEAIALMGGGQIQNPQFTPTPQTGVAPTDVTGAYGLQQSANNTAYTGGVNQASSGNNALAGLLGTGISAGAFAFF